MKSGKRRMSTDNIADAPMFKFCYDYHKKILNPIIDWANEEVWEFIKDYNVPYCELYDKGFKRIGIASDIYFFMMMNGTENNGPRLRGIRDKQYFSSSSGYGDSYACKTSGALAVNIDFPIRVFSTRFEKNRVLRKLNFEVQVSPFIDFALLNNKAAGTIFSIKDGFYAGGLEVIVFPESWKSIQVRASVGFDVGSYLLKNQLNMNWRSDVSPYEVSVGIGLHY